MEMSGTIVSMIEKIQADLAMENKIVDKQATKTEKVKVLNVQHASANNQIDELKSEKAVIKKTMLKNLISTC